MPIRVRLAVACTMLVLVVVAVGGVVFAQVLGTDLVHALDQELRLRAADVAAELHAGATPSTVAGTVAGPQDIYVQEVGADGRVLASSGVALASQLLSLPQLRAAATSGVPVEHDVNQTTAGGGRPDRLRLVVVRATTATAGFVVVGATLDPVDDAVSNVTRELLISGAVATLLAAMGAWTLAGAALRPVERLRSEVARISDGDGTSRLQIPATGDELAALATTMNELLARLQAALARERQLVADTAHELRTPLAILRTELELAGRRERSREELAAAVTSAAQETDRLVRLSEDLLFLARTDEGVPVLRLEPLQLREVLDEAVAAHAARAATAGVTIGTRAPDDLMVVLDEARIRQAVENMIDNAVRVAPAGTTVSIAAESEDSMVVISVSDSGPGFAPEFIAHAFERFRRADAARARDGASAGLGLAIVHAIAQAHRGRAEARNRPEGGATVSLAVPVHGPDEMPR
jgi:signal transduction histidine kinase